MRKHTGPAVVFRDYNDMAARIDAPELDVTTDSVIVLQSAGPQGAPGMPEWGQLPIPQKLLKEGVRDMLRISDARMSGTSYGACVLHVTPESHVGGPLALVRDGDLITLDVEARRIDLRRRRRRTGAPQGRVEGAGGQVHARLRRALSEARAAGRQGLRFRFPGARLCPGRRRRGAGNPLMRPLAPTTSPRERHP